MRYAIIADIHANLAAFTAVLKDIEDKGGVEEVWCLGDIVGYGPDPHECIELFQQYNLVCIAGNHDRAAIGKAETSHFNQFALAALEWTAQQLTASDKEYLGSLPLTLEQEEFLLVHGSPTQPLWEYVISSGIAERNFAFLQSQFCLVGHSHIPEAFKQADDGVKHIHFSEGIGVVLGKDSMIINPGSVGQSRDRDPRASYVIFDSEGYMLRPYRVAYDISATQDKMMRAGLPVHLVTRLESGK
jgi:predicted phosphodiesterase